mmetsp:Transcript_27070/g.81993  ORF Transcript_27070/g.81993 Transcript_27070/m.81993 type:complete len:220 (-) Transcript_27070:283-942(-)
MKPMWLLSEDVKLSLNTEPRNCRQNTPSWGTLGVGEPSEAHLSPLNPKRPHFPLALSQFHPRARREFDWGLPAFYSMCCDEFRLHSQPHLMAPALTVTECASRCLKVEEVEVDEQVDCPQMWHRQMWLVDQRWCSGYRPTPPSSPIQPPRLLLPVLSPIRPATVAAAAFLLARPERCPLALCASEPNHATCASARRYHRAMATALTLRTPRAALRGTVP